MIYWNPGLASVWLWERIFVRHTFGDGASKPGLECLHGGFGMEVPRLGWQQIRSIHLSSGISAFLFAMSTLRIEP